MEGEASLHFGWEDPIVCQNQRRARLQVEAGIGRSFVSGPHVGALRVRWWASFHCGVACRDGRAWSVRSGNQAIGTGVDQGNHRDQRKFDDGVFCPYRRSALLLIEGILATNVNLVMSIKILENREKVEKSLENHH